VTGIHIRRWLFAALLVIAAPCAYSARCSVSTVGLNFGNYDVFSTLDDDITGTINGDTVTLSSSLAPRGDSINFRFTGKLAGETLAGALDMGEYLGATWTAKRRGAGRG